MSSALSSILIQASGSAATLAAALLVAWRLGLAAQGEFGLLRSWSDALVVVAIFGLPQGLLHLQYRVGASAATLRAWTARYLAALTVTAGLAIVLLAAWPALASLPHRQQVMVLLAALPLAAAHQLWRALTLRDAGVVTYALLTAAPALAIFLALVPFLLLDWRSGFEWALFTAAGASALLSASFALRITPGRADSLPWSHRELWSVGLQSGVQSVLTALGPAIQLSVIGMLGASLAQIGAVSLGLQIYQLFAVAAAYAAPLLYDRAARRPIAPVLPDLMRQLRARIAPVWQTLAVMGIAAGALGPWLIRLVWPGMPPVAAMLSLMTLAGTLALAVRLLSTLLQARGEYLALSVQAFARLVGSTLLTIALLAFYPASIAVPSALLAVEALLLAWLVALLRRADVDG